MITFGPISRTITLNIFLYISNKAKNLKKRKYKIAYANFWYLIHDANWQEPSVHGGSKAFSPVAGSSYLTISTKFCKQLIEPLGTCCIFPRCRSSNSCFFVRIILISFLDFLSAFSLLLKLMIKCESSIIRPCTKIISTRAFGGLKIFWLLYLSTYSLYWYYIYKFRNIFIVRSSGVYVR